MQCKDVMSLMEREIAGTLSDESRREMELHFVCCAKCHQAYETRIAGHSQIVAQAQFNPDEEFWRDFHAKLAREIDRKEGFHDRLHRWKLLYFPSALCAYSTFGLFKLGVLTVMMLLLILIFRSEQFTARSSERATITVESDSTGMPIYHSIERR